MDNNILSLDNRRYWGAHCATRVSRAVPKTTMSAPVTPVMQAVFDFIYFFPQGKTHPVIPFAVMSGFAFIAGCLSALLPETLGKPTPETFREDISETSYHQNMNVIEQPLSTTSL